MATLPTSWQHDDDQAAIRERAGGAATGGAFTLIECRVPPYQTGPAFDIPKRAVAAVYMLEGILALTRGAETLTATRGECVVVPAAMACSCWNPAGEPALFLVVYAPADADGRSP